MLNRYVRTSVGKRSCSKVANTFSEDDENKTHFGFQTVEKSEKAKKGKDFIHFFLISMYKKIVKCYKRELNI